MMPSSIGRTARDEDDFPPELLDLGAQLARLPAAQREPLDALYQRVMETMRRRRRVLELVQEALAQLRLDVKYLMFDLEVTRRERDVLRERFDEST